MAKQRKCNVCGVSIDSKARRDKVVCSVTCNRISRNFVYMPVSRGSASSRAEHDFNSK